MEMIKYKCENADCIYCKNWTCTIEGDPMEECDEAPYCAEPIKMTIGELMEMLKKYDPSAFVECCVFDDMGFKDVEFVPLVTRLVWDEDRHPWVQIF